ncbi:MAG: hypothetical protein QM711_07505 [Micropruina sp.]|uniref:hypothetical protein n=1 Tax=Micropruina sp. TaxID=2737536 RepID=UPI0039E2E340
MATALRIAFVSMHTSPADLPGSGDAGGMNVVEYHQAFALARLGHRVDLITRRSDPAQPDAMELLGRRPVAASAGGSAVQAGQEPDRRARRGVLGRPGRARRRL